MRSMAGSRVATYLAAATIVGASAAVCAPDARGDDVLGSPAGSQVTVPSVDATVAARGGHGAMVGGGPDVTDRVIHS